MLDSIFAPFQYEFMVRALIVSVLVGIVCPLIGGYVITRNLSFMGDALAHGVMPGMALGLIVGISPLIAAVPAGILFALLIGFISHRTGLGEDAAIGILFAGMFALGLMILSMADSIKVNIEDLLLGQVLAVSTMDVIVTASLAGVVVVALAAMHRQLMFTSFDPVGAKVVGIPTQSVDYVLLGALALVIVISVQAAGIVLVLAMLVVPAATAYLVARRFTYIMCAWGVSGRDGVDNRAVLFLLLQPAIGPGHEPDGHRHVRPCSPLQASHNRLGVSAHPSRLPPRPLEPISILFLPP